MRLIYIAGMPYSGTTLMDQLLSQHPGVVGLGEVASFLSLPHLGRLRRMWAGTEGAGMCSCGQSWETCPLWSAVAPGSEDDGEAGFLEKYRRLLKRAGDMYGPDVVLIDSSKSQAALDRLVGWRTDLGLEQDAIRVVLAVKDVRGFSLSVASRRSRPASLLDTIRSFNWWLSGNRALVSYLSGSGLAWKLGHYDEMCANPSSFADRIYEWLGLPVLGSANISHVQSHIALGNKGLLLTNKDRIEYDDRWLRDWGIRFIYRLHASARRLNEALRRGGVA